MMTARPQTVGYGATDSPRRPRGVGACASGFAQWAYGDDPQAIANARRRARQHHAVLADEHATSAARLYWENGARGSVIVAATQKDRRDRTPGGPSRSSRRTSIGLRRRGRGAPIAT